VIAITDEIYEHILYDGRKHVSIGALDGMQDRTITIGSFSKTYSVTGWRVGYALAGKEITARLRKIHDFLTVGAPAPLQHACVAALQLPESYYHELAREYDRKRHILFNGLKKAGFTCQLPEGAYYIFTDIAGFGMKDTEFAAILWKRPGWQRYRAARFTMRGAKRNSGSRSQKRMRRWSRRAGGLRRWGTGNSLSRKKYSDGMKKEEEEIYQGFPLPCPCSPGTHRPPSRVSSFFQMGTPFLISSII
jgi:histidinol-phosphate/aromatic aminotransferase/cobyric acid decarboxylase-like protein